nr:MAG TPA: Cell-membrane associated Mucin15 [Caudoviricetes sp.]
MLWKLGIFFIAIGLMKLAYYFIRKRRDQNAGR